MARVSAVKLNGSQTPKTEGEEESSAFMHNPKKPDETSDWGKVFKV